MCGIFGVKRMGPQAERINVWQIEQLALEMQKRGGDATGVCFQRKDGSITWHKAPLIAWNFLRSAPWQKFLEKVGMDADGNMPEDIMTMIGHTRAWTKGLPSFNENNHPLVNMEAPESAVVHNGGVWNDDELFKEMRLKRVGEVDSDILRAILDEHGLTRKGVKELNKARGFVAMAAVSTKYPDMLLLARSGSPMVIGLLDDSRHLIFASTKDGVHKVSRRWIKKYGLDWQRNRTDLRFNPVEREAAFFITSAGIEEPVEQFGTTQMKHQVTYRVYDTYKDKHRRIKQEENKDKVKAIVERIGPEEPAGIDNPEYVECPNCHKAVKLAGAERSTPLWELECGNCGTLLKEEA